MRLIHHVIAPCPLLINMIYILFAPMINFTRIVDCNHHQYYCCFVHILRIDRSGFLRFAFSQLCSNHFLGSLPVAIFCRCCCQHLLYLWLIQFWIIFARKHYVGSLLWIIVACMFEIDSLLLYPYLLTHV